MEEVGEDDVEVEEAVRLLLLLPLLGGVGSGDVDGEVEVGEGAAGGGDEGVEGVLVGRHRDEASGCGGDARWRGGSRRAAAYRLTGGGLSLTNGGGPYLLARGGGGGG